MNDFEKICRNTSKKLSAYTREHCIKLGLMNGPKKQNNSRTNYQRVNNMYRNPTTRRNLNPALQFLGKKRSPNAPKSSVKWVSNGRGGWVRSNHHTVSVKPKSTHWVPNGRGGWKKANNVAKIPHRVPNLVPNGRGGWKKPNSVAKIPHRMPNLVPNGRGGFKYAAVKTLPMPMKCDCKRNMSNGQKYCRCNVPNMPIIHQKWVATNF